MKNIRNNIMQDNKELLEDLIKGLKAYLYSDTKNDYCEGYNDGINICCKRIDQRIRAIEEYKEDNGE